MRVDCGQLDPGTVIRPEPGEWHPRMPDRLGEEELADWRAGRNALYQLAALTIGARPRSPEPKRTRNRPNWLQPLRSIRSIVSTGIRQRSATWETDIPYLTRVRRRASFFTGISGAVDRSGLTAASTVS